MLKIRLKRVGRRNDPSFRIVVTESARGPKSNKAVDLVGFYNPKTKERKLDNEKINHWISSGAQVSDTVYNMLVDAGLVTGKKKNVLPRKSPVLKEATEEVVADKGDAPTEASEETSENSSTEIPDEPTPEEQSGPVSEETSTEEPEKTE